MLVKNNFISFDDSDRKKELNTLRAVGIYMIRHFNVARIDSMLGKGPALASLGGHALYGLVLGSIFLITGVWN